MIFLSKGIIYDRRRMTKSEIVVPGGPTEEKDKLMEGC